MAKKEKPKEPVIIQTVTITTMDNGKQNIATSPELGGWAILGFLESLIAAMKK